MSLDDYRESRVIEVRGYQFYALVMAAMRQADDRNAPRLRGAFPEVWDELQERYSAPDGLIGKEVKDGKED